MPLYKRLANRSQRLREERRWFLSASVPLLALVLYALYHQAQVVVIWARYRWDLPFLESLASPICLALLALWLLWGWVTIRRPIWEVEADLDHQGSNTFSYFPGRPWSGLLGRPYRSSNFGVLCFRFAGTVPAIIAREIIRSFGRSPEDLPLELETLTIEILRHYQERRRLPGPGELEGVEDRDLERALAFLTHLDLVRFSPDGEPRGTFALEDFLESA